MTQNSGPVPPPPQAGGYSPVPGYPAAPPAKGTSGWAMGFLAYIPVPFLGQVVAGIAMALQYRALRRKGWLSEANGRHAANWGLTYVFVTVVLIAAGVACGVLSNVTTYTRGFGIAGVTLICVWVFGLNILHVVLTIVGTIKSHAGKVFANVVQIPFIREQEPVVGPGGWPDRA